MGNRGARRRVGWLCVEFANGRTANNGFTANGHSMHVKRLMAQDFRRFLDLEIVDIPQTAKLVVVAGPNGNGKSSLFDIFLRYKYRYIGFHGWNQPYHSRIS